MDFGDLITARSGVAGTSSGPRGVSIGGVVQGTNKNEIEYFTLTTCGDGTDFGDLSVARREASSSSDSHGGLANGADRSSLLQ